MPTLGGNNPDLRVRSVSKLAPTDGMSWSRYTVHNAQMALEAANSEAAVSEPFSRRRSSTQPVGGYPKRCVDILVALSAILLTLPLMGAITVLLYCSGGSPIFSHERVGFGGRKFRCLKFRTMVPDAGTLLADLFAERPDLEEQWTTRRKLADDPRITPLGRFLRQSSLDELPQLFNVLRGDMSCVGPRPVTEEELEHYGPSNRGVSVGPPGPDRALAGLGSQRGVLRGPCQARHGVHQRLVAPFRHRDPRTDAFRAFQLQDGILICDHPRSRADGGSTKRFTCCVVWSLQGNADRVAGRP